MYTTDNSNPIAVNVMLNVLTNERETFVTRLENQFIGLYGLNAQNLTKFFANNITANPNGSRSIISTSNTNTNTNNTTNNNNSKVVPTANYSTISSNLISNPNNITVNIASMYMANMYMASIAGMNAQKQNTAYALPTNESMPRLDPSGL